MATKNELQDRVSELEETLEEILSLAGEIRNKAREALEEEGGEKE